MAHDDEPRAPSAQATESTEDATLVHHFRSLGKLDHGPFSSALFLLFLAFSCSFFSSSSFLFPLRAMILSAVCSSQKARWRNASGVPLRSLLALVAEAVAAVGGAAAGEKKPPLLGVAA
ncbi:MAG: hypothetical protein HYZ17_04555 [Betaproteobacteria bacterium]|nr:hypothetical protein [Betaproteobacteria bacterium]